MKRFNFSEGNQFVVINKHDFDAIVAEAVLARESSVKGTRVESVVAPPPTGESELLTRKQTSTLLHVDNSTLWRWEKSGYLRPIHVGHRVLYSRSDVDEVIRKGGVAV